MGIQNGSERILQFYDRPTPPARVAEAATILSRYSAYMIAPAYDIIVDNPVETREDVVKNIEFLDRLARPFTLNVFSLRSIPNTRLEKQLEERHISIDEISANYIHNAPTLANCLVFLIGAFRPPRFIYDFLIARAKPVGEHQPLFPRLTLFCRAVYLVKRAFNHLRFMDFSVLTGRTGYLLWRSGLIGFWWTHVVPRYRLAASPEPVADPRPPARPSGRGLHKNLS
jgi:hypothetical protein